MKLSSPDLGHLTYCTNIHAGETWPDVLQNLKTYLPQAKAALSPDAPFGVGLRLSYVAAEALSDAETLSRFKSFLKENGLYVFTLNGFPYGEFHGQPVKEAVYLPDWRDSQRLTYSNTLADILAAILPDGVDGTISTVPGAFKPNVKTPADVTAMAQNMIRHVAHLVGLQILTGKAIALTLEPEPCCFIETIDETVHFFKDNLFSDNARSFLMSLTDLDDAGADEALCRHLGVCLDLCHAAVEFEDAREVVGKLRSANIPIGKMQISAGLRFAPVGDQTIGQLKPFEDAVYLHQTIASNNGTLTRYVDLKDAFEARSSGAIADEWRVHFHVPIFLDDLGDFATTQNFIREMLQLHKEQPISNHLEVETYTWNVLPEEYRNVDVVSAIVRELTWVRQQLAEI